LQKTGTAGGKMGDCARLSRLPCPNRNPFMASGYQPEIARVRLIPVIRPTSGRDGERARLDIHHSTAFFRWVQRYGL